MIVALSLLHSLVKHFRIKPGRITNIYVKNILPNCLEQQKRLCRLKQVYQQENFNDMHVDIGFSRKLFLFGRA